MCKTRCSVTKRKSTRIILPESESPFHHIPSMLWDKFPNLCTAQWECNDNHFIFIHSGGVRLDKFDMLWTVTGTKNLVNVIISGIVEGTVSSFCKTGVWTVKGSKDVSVKTSQTLKFPEACCMSGFMGRCSSL